MHIRKEDLVEVRTGESKQPGRARRVIRVLAAENRLVVEGVNLVYKHVKPSRRNPQGGRLSKEMPISASNVLLYCSTCRRGRRSGHRYAADGRKERYCKKCGAALGTLSKPREKYARKG